jgi:O-glycosyl hydrolase
MKKYILILAFCCGHFLYGQEDSVLTVIIDKERVYQEIKGFGASDAWRTQFVGEHWPEEKRNHIADLLFSLEDDKDGNPKGIGLSAWRFYLGAGSMEQGDSSDIQNVWRRSESFLDEEGNYDWTKYKGQRWFLQAAKKRGVNEFLIFTISPPVFYTKNGLAHATKGDLGFNLKPDNYDDYTVFLADVIEHFEKEENLSFDYISPFNEPQWAWDKSNQEGTPATNNELYVYLKYLSDILHKRGLKTKIIAGEAATFNYLYEPAGDNFNGDQINVFFNPESPLYIGGFKNLEYAISAHSYFTTWGIENQIETRKQLARRIKEINPNLDFWQTEFCILEKNDEIEGGWGRDLGMPTALYVARVIHSDLTIANARCWDWWTALSQFNFKDGLIHLDDGKGNGVVSDTSELNHQLMYDGHITETKLLWALGNFSRFVRPEMFRIDAKINNDLNLIRQATDLQVSAYKDPVTGKVVVVFINHEQEDKSIKLDGIESGEAILYVTDESKNLGKMKVEIDQFSIPKRSVSTLVIEL